VFEPEDQPKEDDPEDSCNRAWVFPTQESPGLF
jgi:hypothetical protein